MPAPENEQEQVTQWIKWAQKLQAIAQNGLNFSQNPFDRLRYEDIKVVAAQIFSSFTGTGTTAIMDIFDSQAGYATPKVDVRGVIFKDEKILLVKELSDGGWTLPGGWVDVGESPSQAVEREVWEESGYIVQAVKLMAVYDRNLHGHPPHPFQIYKLFFLCQLTGGNAVDSIETTQASFFTEEEIPPLSLARTTPGQIKRAFEYNRQPDLETDFD